MPLSAVRSALLSGRVRLGLLIGALVVAVAVLSIALLGGGGRDVNVLVQTQAPAVGTTAGPSPSASTYPLPTPPPDPTEGPRPSTYPGSAKTAFRFFNHDPRFDAVFYLGEDSYGPFKPWTRSKLIAHTTGAGLVIRVVFPDRHECDAANRPLERPQEGTLTVGAQPVYLTRDCAGLIVWGGDGVPDEEPWTVPPTATPSPESTPTPSPSPSTPEPTSTPTTSGPTPT